MRQVSGLDLLLFIFHRKEEKRIELIITQFISLVIDRLYFFIKLI